MFRKKLCVAFIAFLLIQESVQGKKSRKNRRPKPEEEEVYTPQPSVVSYSTFGFNDVGTYEGFVPSSPDYAKFLSGGNEESTTGVHPSSFPTSPDFNDFGNTFNSQPFSGQSFSISDDAAMPSNLAQYPQNSVGHFNVPSFDTNVEQHRNIAAEEIYGRNTEDVNAPTYGTKLNSKNKNMMSINQYNNTDFSGPSGIQNEDKFSHFQEVKPPFEHNKPFYEVKPTFASTSFHETKIFENRPFHEAKPTFQTKPLDNESSNAVYNNPSYSSTGTVDYNNQISNDAPNQVKFQRVVDFTKLKQHYPTELDTSRLPTATPIPDVYENNESGQNKNTFNFNDDSNKHLFSPATKHRDNYKQNHISADTYEKHAFKVNNMKGDTFNYNGYASGKDNLLISNVENKKKSKVKPSSSGGHFLKKWKEPFSNSKGYEYSTNYSSMSFSFDSDKDKITKPLGSGIDELNPASTIDSPNYLFPETDFTNFKKMPEYKVHEDDEYNNFLSFKESLKSDEFEYNPYKNVYSTTPTTTNYWGNAFKSSDTSSLKSHSFANKYKQHRDNDEVVNIPRRPNRPNYDKPFESKPNEWSQYNRRPYKNRPYKDWENEVPITRFKSEEDLLDLRNQDTSHPSYLPSFQSSKFASDEIDYKKMVEKWRQSYLKSKFKDSSRDYESNGAETKLKHVPVPKPYPALIDSIPSERDPFHTKEIEVPHPVIVPVPQPYPVRVPIAKPVAVPVVRELKIPIEKPMPYLVYKDVPYPIEKPVPVPVQKEVTVPVVKPYPVHIPYIRPVFHHTKSRDEYDSDHRDDDDYLPRPEGKNKYSQYRKRSPNGTRSRLRRPSRTAYQDRNRRRWPERRRPAEVRDDLPRMRPIELHHPSPFKRRDSETTKFEDNSNNFF